MKHLEEYELQLAAEDGRLARQAATHLSGCRECGDRVTGIRAVVQAIRTAPRRPAASCPEPKTWIQLAEGLLRGRLLESARNHLMICRSCREDASFAKEALTAMPMDLAPPPELLKIAKNIFAKAFPPKAPRREGILVTLLGLVEKVGEAFRPVELAPALAMRGRGRTGSEPGRGGATILGSRIEGVVHSADGKRRAGVAVQLLRSGKKRSIARTNRKGVFRFERLAPGMYEVRAPGFRRRVRLSER